MAATSVSETVPFAPPEGPNDAGSAGGISWRSEPISKERALAKMLKNARKAIEEHQQDVLMRTGETRPYITTIDFAPEDCEKKESTPLQISHQFSTNQGSRKTMEDVHFFKKLDKGTLIGVLDGHGGKAVAEFVKDEFQKRFPDALAQANGNVHQAFETVFDQIQQEVARKSEWERIGSTAVISYIEHETHLIYTATLGDSEANIYRKERGEILSIPLSPIRNWLSHRDRQRLIDNHGILAQGYIALAKSNPKLVRSHLKTGVNISRVFGDLYARGEPSKPLVIHKPKITVYKLKRYDILLLASDGLKDYMSEAQIAAKISSYIAPSNSLSDTLVQHALISMGSTIGDNVTVGIIEIV